MEATGASAGTATSGLSKLIGTIVSLAAVKKGMSVTDEYINTSSRLSLINDGLQTQAELQEKIFDAAERAKGSYSDMAGAIAKMGLLAGDAFSSNDELIAFTELVQKSFKVSGADTSEQQGAMRQLSQAMASGRLQGDELVSIMENAPMIYEAIAKYTGLTKGELKELSSDGAITADIIKNAMFMAGDGINAKFEEMPLTFGDIWTRIKNSGTQAFMSIMEKVNELINTDGFQGFINGLTVGFELVADVAGWAIDTIINGWDTIGPILGIIGTVLLISIIGSLWAMIPPLLIQAAAWLQVYWPLLLIVGIIAIAISAARQLGVSWEQIFGFVGGVIGMFVAFFYNEFVSIWNFIGAFINFFGNVFRNPVASIKVLFYDLAANVIGHVTTMARAIETIINKIPGVNVDMTSGLDNFKDKLEKASGTIKSEAELVEYVQSKEYMDYSDGYNKGNSLGKNIANNIGTALDKLTDSMSDKEQKGIDTSQFGAPGKPLEVKGKGKNGKVEVEMSKESMEYLRDVAERDYINKFSTATLAPNVAFHISDIKETADVNKIKGVLEDMMRKEIATAAEGVY